MGRMFDLVRETWNPVCGCQQLINVVTIICLGVMFISVDVDSDGVNRCEPI
jgi:hypothetical protein